jgi:hypothetical protein
MKHSTGKPTKREAEYIERCKTGPCVACSVWDERSDGIPYGGPCDFHHMKSGNIRRGHMFGVGLCIWHHRGVVDESLNVKNVREMCGPSLMDGSRKFHLTYGSDDDLIALQRELIGWEDVD